MVDNETLTKEQIKLITQLRLERVERTTRGQGIELKFTDAVLDRLADVSYVPEFGARELKRKIQTEIETPLAREILSGSIPAGDLVRVDFDKSNGKVTFVKHKFEWGYWYFWCGARFVLDNVK
jgi:ATP-dependent Clp protease ATP-binding subunit ClpC